MRLWTFFASLTALFVTNTAVAQDANQDLEVVGVPTDAGTSFQPAVTELASDILWLDNMLMIILTAIVVGVVGLLAAVIVLFNRHRNPTPATFTHNSPLEVTWTIVPIIILVVIGAFSLPILFKQQEIPEADLTIKVTGYQWYWGYEYVDHGFYFDSYMIGHPATLTSDDGDDVMPYVLSPGMEAKLVKAGYSRDEWLLATDTAVVVPVGKTVVMQVTGADVIHSWTIPAFGVKQDGVPGRLAELWFSADREGVYFGQCSELCGISHAYMPITVKVVSEEAYAKWLAEAKQNPEWQL